MGTSDDHLDAARLRLGHLARLQQATDASAKAIRSAAESRLRAVNSDLDRLRSRAITDDDAGEEYRALTTERGQLQGVLASLDMDEQA
jgi:hypothetical protein